MSRNDEVAQQLEAMADLLEAMDVEFKPRAYRRAAERIGDLGRPIETVAEGGEQALTEIDDIGGAIAEKIIEYLDTGEIEELEKLREELPVEMDALQRVEGLGPKRIGALYETLGITTLDELEAAATAGEIQSVDGFGSKTEANILERIPFAKAAKERHLLVYGVEVAEDLLAELDGEPAVERSSVAGSIRRWVPTVGDVDILVATDDPDTVMATIEASDAVATVIEAGEQKARVRSIDDVSVDFRFIDPDSFGAAQQYFTGSKDHNVTLRSRAIDRGLKINEYGVFDGDDTRLAGETEAEVYDAVDLPVIEPELRENRGEIEAAEDDALPELLEPTDIRGDLHLHTTWSDGGADIGEMIDAASDRGYDYIAITDHAPGAGVRADITVSVEQLYEQQDAIQSARAATDLTVFHGVEANIETDGSIDLPAELLSTLDLVIASPHAGLNQDTDQATDRIVAAIEHPHVDIIGHPTGRKLNQRPGLDLDLDPIVATAASNDVALEVNSHPVRLDIEGSAVKRTIEAGAPIAISTDAHRAGELDLMRFGVRTARRGWAESADVINTGSVEELTAWLS